MESIRRLLDVARHGGVAKQGGRERRHYGSGADGRDEAGRYRSGD